MLFLRPSIGHDWQLRVKATNESSLLTSICNRHSLYSFGNYAVFSIFVHNQVDVS